MTIIEINGMIDDWGYVTSNVRYQLAKHAGQPVTCRVNSFGGSVNEALNIAQAFADHGDVTCQLLAFNASAATWMVYGARRVEIADDGFWFCHRSTVGVDIWKDMNVNDINDAIEALKSQAKSQQAIDLMIAKKYIDHAAINGVKHNVEDILALMNEQRWLPAAEAHALGFVDAIVKYAKSVSEDTCNFVKATAANLNLPAPPTLAVKKDGIMTRLTRFLGLGSTPETTQEQPADPPATETSAGNETQDKTEKPGDTENIIQKPITINMKESHKNLFALLGIEDLQENEGKVTLTTGQLNSIESALAEAANIKAAVAEVDATLSNVSDTVKGISGVNNKALALIAMLNRTPMAVPAAAGATPVKDEKKEREEAIKKHAVDPINEEAKAFRR